MNPNRCSLWLVALAVLLSLSPIDLSAQTQSRWVLGIGFGRQFPQRPVMSTEGSQPDHTLDDASAPVVGIDYWFTRMFGARLAYQWVRTDVGEPDIPSFARIYSLYSGLIFSPGTIAQRARPYLIAGGGARRYDVNAILPSSTGDFDIAPTQIKLAGYGGLGLGVRIAGLEVVPEAGYFVNSFEPNRGTAPTQLDLVLSLKIQTR